MEGWAEKHFQDGSVELQIPPLRYATVGMTKGRAVLPFGFVTADGEQQVPPIRYATVGMTLLLGRHKRTPSVRQPLSIEASSFPLSSRAKPRDLQFHGPILEMCFSGTANDDLGVNTILDATL
jgi:hypothetical protein